MTTRLPVIGLDSLPAVPGPDAVIYVKPLEDGRRVAADADSRARVLIRTSRAVHAVETDLEDIRRWAGGLAGGARGRVTRQLANCRKTPLAFAGLDVSFPVVMGIVNVTPDSFSDGGRALDPDDAYRQGIRMVREGAGILDVGGESTRPGADPVDETEEIARVLPVVESLRASGAAVSIDSRKAAVMRAALQAGASIVNDVSALARDPAAMAVVADRGAPVILMHALADPRTMQTAPAYDHVSLDVYDYLETRIAACMKAGIGQDRIAIDPGIGFGKTLDHNLALLRDLSLFRSLGCAILLGASRKSFIGRLAGVREASQRVAGSLAAALAGVREGVHLLRVHDVGETVQALAVWRAVTEVRGT